MVFFDYSPNALEVRKFILDEWNGRDFPSFCERIFEAFPAPETGVVAPRGVVGVRELGAGDGESLDERGIAFDDEQHQSCAREKSDGGAERSRACKEVPG